MTAEAGTPESSGTSSTVDSSPPTPSAPPKPWSGLGYEPVPGLTNRLISRYLRGQRKNMIRFFHERRMFEFEDRMQKIRKDPAMGMMEKNRKFQEILNDYAQSVAPAGSAPTAAAEAADQRAVPVLDPDPANAVAVQADGGPGGDGVHAGAGLQGLAVEDNGPVIEE
jgi:hypothetical protein